LAGAVNLFSAVAAIKANYPQAVTRSQVIAPVMVEEMQFSANRMATRSVEVERVTYASHRPLADLLAKPDSKIGDPDRGKFNKDQAVASTEQELEQEQG
jgi:hypothetical protein